MQAKCAAGPVFRRDGETALGFYRSAAAGILADGKERADFSGERS
jgi:hypothetical protein